MGVARFEIEPKPREGSAHFRVVVAGSCRLLLCARRFATSDRVNLSPRQFNEERLLGSVEAILAETGLPRETLVLEITELPEQQGEPQADWLDSRLRGSGPISGMQARTGDAA